MPKFMDLTGLSFGLLKATSVAKERGAAGQVIWECHCDCGGKKSVMAQNLRNGHVTSCGCVSFVRPKRVMARSPTDARLRTIHRQMKHRCQCETSSNYKNYGGRGISVGQDFMDLAVFVDWALKNGYAPGLTLERINNEGDYTASNCKWATRAEQSRNKRTNVLNWELVGSIRSRSAGCEEVGRIAQSLGLGKKTVLDVVNKKSWNT